MHTWPNAVQAWPKALHVSGKALLTWPKAAHICAKVVHILRFLVGPASSADVGPHLRGIVLLGQDDGFALRVPLPLLANQLFP